MNRARLVTINQAIKLKELGFNDCVSHYVMKFDGIKYDQKWITESSLTNWNSQYYENHYSAIYLSVPTVDEAIDWIRRKFNIVIYLEDPYTDPLNDKIILYSYKVELYNIGRNWNMYEQLGQSNRSPNVYGMKRQAIWLAIRWIIKSRKRKTKYVSLKNKSYDRSRKRKA
jgi:hypothetical protein